MKFGQLIKYSMKNILLEKSYTKGGGETIPINFSKKAKVSTLQLFVNQIVAFIAVLLFTLLSRNKEANFKENSKFHV